MKDITRETSGICDHASHDCTCPFAFTEESKKFQNYGCLPTPHEIIVMRVEHGKTWACHGDRASPCIGAIRHLKEHAMPYKVIDPVLLTEQSDWGRYAVSAHNVTDDEGEHHDTGSCVV